MAVVINNRVLEIASRILEYLEKRPRAEDAYNGILEWWLLQQMIELDAKDVRQALRELGSRGLLVESVGFDRQVLYSFNPEKIEAANAFRREAQRLNSSDTEPSSRDKTR